MPQLKKILIAHRGEIAVRVIRACRDAGLASVAVYAEPDRDAMFTRLADEAFALGGSTAVETYLDTGKLLDIAARAGADAVHPGYGFLAENAEFAQAVIDAGLTWIGPDPQAIRDLTSDPAAGPDERYLDKPRHVDVQVLADKHGNVIVVGTRDCSLQRRHHKLVEEAPAPLLSDEQRAAIHSSAKAICKQAGYSGAGTVEYLVGTDGTISFLRVNTRLQVGHPVSEETTGIDLVREQFRIAAGERLRFTSDPAPRGHSIEFRINGEDAGRDFLPAPGVVTRFVAPDGPGVRVDSGVESGTVIGGQFDSLLAKVIVTGATREEALERSRRALDEMIVEGMPTVLPFHRMIVRDPAFIGDGTGFTVHTRWIETEFDNTIEPFVATEELPEPDKWQSVVVEIDGRRVEVSLPGGLATGAGTPKIGVAKPRKRAGGKVIAAPGDAVAAPTRELKDGDAM